MTIFLDTANIEEIKRFHKMGVLRGVTTNPSILLTDGVTGDIKSRIETIASIIFPYPVSVELVETDKKLMIDEAKWYKSWKENIVVKVTIHGPNGELENVDVIHELENIHNIRTNVTATMNAQQCLLAALAGASYVSIFGGRINNMGYNACDEIRKLRTVLTNNELNSKIIVGSTREVLNVIEWLEAGAHIVTVTPKLLEQMFIHPYTKETVQAFLNDSYKLGTDND